MKTLCLTIICCLPLIVSAQQRFLDPSFDFSEKKISYLTLKDGSEIQCNLKKLKYDKGLIEEIKIEMLDDSKVKVQPEDIAYMYLPPSGLDKLVKMDNLMTDATLWDEEALDGDLIGNGYVYFEQCQVRMKNKTETYMLQLLNPHFSGKIRVYHDPFANETTSVGVAGFKVAGGLDKSYYVRKGDVATLLKKKDYEEEFPLYFKDCKKLKSKYASDVKWSEFVDHIYFYASECE